MPRGQPASGQECAMDEDSLPPGERMEAISEGGGEALGAIYSRGQAWLKERGLQESASANSDSGVTGNGPAIQTASARDSHSAGECRGRSRTGKHDAPEKAVKSKAGTKVRKDGEALKKTADSETARQTGDGSAAGCDRKDY